MLLVTTSISEFWGNDDTTLLFLGPWCTLYNRREDWLGRKHVMLSNPWDDREKLYKAAIYCETVFSRVLEELSQYLNAVHGTQYSQRYWRILVGPWLLYYIHCLYGRYTYVMSAVRQFPGLSTCCLCPADFITPNSFNHYGNLVNEDRYNVQLFSMIAFWLGITCSVKSFPKRIKDEEGKGSNLIGLVSNNLKTKVEALAYGSINSICRKRQSSIVIADPQVSLSCRLTWNLHKRKRGHTGILCNGYESEEIFDPVWNNSREDLTSLKGDDEFTKCLISMLAANFPTMYMEGYDNTKRRALRDWNYTPKVCAASFSWYYKELFKFLAAEWSEKKCRMIGFQHGGGYGIGRYVASEWYETNMVDRFYAWGWASSTSDGRLKDLPSPLLSEEYRKSGLPSQVLLVGTGLFRYPFRLDSLPQDSQIESYLQWRIRFVNALQGDSKKALLVRLTTPDRGWCEKEQMQDACGQLKYDSLRTSLKRQLGRTRLVVFDHQTTTHLEALSRNIPCILFWQPNYWELREEAVPFYRALSECGILHDGPEKAAAKVMEVYDNPLTWWASESVQNVRRSFVSRYALGRKNWMDSWINALENEAVLNRASCHEACP